MSGAKREPGEDRPQKDEFEPAKKPSIEVEREKAGVDEDKGHTKPAAPDETLLPPD